MTKDQINHFLPLFIGECWHEWNLKIYYDRQDVHCVHCSAKAYNDNGEGVNFNPDFSTPTDFDRLRKWMEKNQVSLWAKYLEYICNKTTRWDMQINQDEPINYYYILCLDAQLNPLNLAEFLIRERDAWEWIKCDKCDKGLVPSTPNYFNIKHHAKKQACNYCNGKGKIQHPAASYYDSLKEAQ